jgi:hypothetical protein
MKFTAKLSSRPRLEELVLLDRSDVRTCPRYSHTSHGCVMSFQCIVTTEARHAGRVRGWSIHILVSEALDPVCLKDRCRIFEALLYFRDHAGACSGPISRSRMAVWLHRWAGACNGCDECPHRNDTLTMRLVMCLSRVRNHSQGILTSTSTIPWPLVLGCMPPAIHHLDIPRQCDPPCCSLTRAVRRCRPDCSGYAFIYNS